MEQKVRMDSSNSPLRRTLIGEEGQYAKTKLKHDAVALLMMKTLVPKRRTTNYSKLSKEDAESRKKQKQFNLQTH